MPRSFRMASLAVAALLGWAGCSSSDGHASSEDDSTGGTGGGSNDAAIETAPEGGPEAAPEAAPDAASDPAPATEITLAAAKGSIALDFDVQAKGAAGPFVGDVDVKGGS